jgi:hypothetical protein
MGHATPRAFKGSIPYFFKESGAVPSVLSWLASRNRRDNKAGEVPAAKQGPHRLLCAPGAMALVNAKGLIRNENFQLMEFAKKILIEPDNKYRAAMTAEVQNGS